jgi:DNA-binding transcriptional LysR family regulator
MLAFVATGEGIALLPELFLSAEPAGIRYVGTDCPPFEMFAVWSKDYADPHVPAYLDILRKKNEAAGMAPAASRRPPICPASQTRPVRSV